MCAMFIILVAFASVKMAFDSVPLALFSRASGLIGTEYTMREFADNPELAEKCSKNAVKIREKLSVEKITNQWIEIIENCYKTLQK